MAQYYYLNGQNEQQGPVSANELLKCGVTRNTMVWKEGLDSWKAADTLPELAGIFSPTQLHLALTCPNCGAEATNHKNCEYCGSLLVQLAGKAIKIPTYYTNNANVFPGLIDALKQNLDKQKKYPNEIVVTDVFKKVSVIEAGIGKTSVIAEIHRDVADGKGMPFFPDADFSKGQQHLMVVFAFDNIAVDMIKHNKFKKLDIYDLFTCRKFSGQAYIGSGYSYAIDFGGDAEGAARLLSRILQEVYGIEYGTQLEYNTFAGSSDDIDKGRKNAKPWHERYMWWILNGGGLFVLFQILTRSCE